MNNEELLRAISTMMDEKLAPINERLDKVEARLDKVEHGLHQVEKELDTLTLPTGDIVTQMGEMLDDKLSKLSFEMQWTKQATAQNSLDIAALKIK